MTDQIHDADVNATTTTTTDLNQSESPEMKKSAPDKSKKARNPDAVIAGKTGSVAMFFPDRKGHWGVEESPHVGEHPKGFDVKSPKRPKLRDILLSYVPSFYDLTAKACFGIECRAELNGKPVKVRLQMAIDEAVAHGLEEVEDALAEEDAVAQRRLSEVEAVLARLREMTALSREEWASAAEELAVSVSTGDAFGGRRKRKASDLPELLRSAAAAARETSALFEAELTDALASVHKAHGEALEQVARVEFKRGCLMECLVRYLADDYPPTSAKASSGNGDHCPKTSDERTGTLRAQQGGEGVYVGYAEEPAAFTESSFGAHAEVDASGTLRASGGAVGGGSETLIVQAAPKPAVEEKASAFEEPGDVVCVQNNVVSRGFDAGANGAGFATETSYCLDTGHPHCVAHPVEAACFQENSRSEVREVAGGVAGCLTGPSRKQANLIHEFMDVHPEVVGTLLGSGAGMSRTAGVRSEADFAVAQPVAVSGVPLYDRVARAAAKEMSYEQLRAEVFKARAVRPRQHRVRRLTPPECALLQGFPVDWLLVPDTAAQKRRMSDAEAVERRKMYASAGVELSLEEVKCLMPDSVLYHMIGNSMHTGVVGRVLTGLLREAADRRGDWFKPEAA